MKNKATLTWIILIALTITSALLSRIENKYIVFSILILAALKFLAVAFQFMEIKKAHVFWKTIIISFIFLFGVGLLIAL